MKTRLIIGTSIVISAVLLLSFTERGNTQKKTEEYAFIISYSNNSIEKTANGKTVIIKLETEKIEGAVGARSNNNALAIELNKMNEDGYEIVNVSATVSENLTRELYLFKRKI